MLSRVPVNLDRLAKTDVDKEVLRAAIIAELDAINLYEQMAHMATNKAIREILLDVAKEEKTHVGEFQATLLRVDRQQEEELNEGKKEVEGLLQKE
ncbi:MAG: ferritin family protein [Acidobacteriota bacterium]